MTREWENIKRKFKQGWPALRQPHQHPSPVILSAKEDREDTHVFSGLDDLEIENCPIDRDVAQARQQRVIKRAALRSFAIVAASLRIF
jgi:hypothetical protein